MYQFEIYGKPVPQKQTRFCLKGGFARPYDPSIKDKQQIQWQIKPNAPKIPLTCPIHLSIAFYLLPPKTASKATKKAMLGRTILPNRKPDIDNLAYIITNALKGIVYEDDSQICKMTLYKIYGKEEKTSICVREILQLQEFGLHEITV